MPQEKSERRILKLSGNMHVINLDASGKAIEEEREEVSDHIAHHDPHAETLRLLDEIRAHLAAMSQSAKQEGTQ